MDSVKSTVSVLEEGGGFNWRGYFSVGGYQFLWRRESSASGVGGHTSLGGGGGGCILISRRGSSASGVGVILRWGMGGF